MSKVLVTIAFVVNGFPEDQLHELVGAIEDGMSDGVMASLANYPDLTQQQLAEIVQFYGATVTLERPLRGVRR